jgi:flagellar M-ring protein FliF
MDFLNKSYQQIAELFHSMTPAARMTTALLLGVIVVSLVFLFRGKATSADAYLFGARPLTDGEIAAMEGAFAKAGLNDSDNEGNRIRVPRGQRYAYLAALVDGNAFPQDAGSAWRDMFAAENPFQTRQTRELHEKFAIQKDLSFTIRALSGISDASVVLSEIETDTFPPRTERRAVVTVKASGGAPLDALRIRQIRDTIAYGGGVERHNILVSDTNGRSYAGPPRDGSVESEQSLYTERQREREAEIKAKIESHLRDVYPGITVAVRAELDPKISSTERQITYDEKPTPLEVRENQIDETSSSSRPGGRPGAEPNSCSNRAAAVGGGPAAETSRTETSTLQRNVPGIKQTDIHSSGLQERLVTVSIAVPRTLFKKIWRQKNPVVEGEEDKQPEQSELKAIENEIKTNIQSAAVMLIPKAPLGEDTFPRVEVTAFDDIPIPDPVAPGVSETAGSWFVANWQTLALFALGCFAIVFLRGMIQSAQTAAFEDAQAKRYAIERAADLANDDEEEEDGHDLGEFGNSLRGRFQSSGRSLREELTELVRDDPDAAANVIQNWMREAA